MRPRMYDILALFVLGELASRIATYENNLAALLGQPVQQLTQGRMSYQLRRSPLHGQIGRIPKTHRYRLTSFGFHVAMFCTRNYARILRPGLAWCCRQRLRSHLHYDAASIKLEQEINSWVDQAKLAA